MKEATQERIFGGSGGVSYNFLCPSNGNYFKQQIRTILTLN